VARLRGYLQPAGSGLARELGRAGTVVLGPRGADITQPVRTAFERLKPVCGGDSAAAARQALSTVLSGQRKEERP
jgi:hypothetical protein